MGLQPYLALPRIWHYALRAVCALILVFLVAPILVVMPLSFNAEPFFSYPMPGMSLRWYEYALHSESWRRAAANSFAVAIASTCVATSLGTLAALGMSRGNFPLKRMVMALLISPMIVPAVITAVAVYFFFAKLNLIGTYIGLILGHTVIATPFVVITVTATLSGFDKTMARAGASLGAGPLRVFFKITMPLILPGVFAGSVFAFVTSFDDVVLALFLSGPEQLTLPRAMWTGVREGIDPTILAVACFVAFVSLLALTSIELLRRRNQRLRSRRD